MDIYNNKGDIGTCLGSRSVRK